MVIKELNAQMMQVLFCLYKVSNFTKYISTSHGSHFAYKMILAKVKTLLYGPNDSMLSNVAMTHVYSCHKLYTFELLCPMKHAPCFKFEIQI
ncbi:hypothetical protein HanLR1_Chr17g0676261 [Helianthus annuus]|nr:hypothetical protein HanHA89_Chr17g0717811 [Helianthus annuus]KAJ0633395.1 hypothetical protein HanLR1_Chr17g0676261 [Helianthus annuus]